MHVAVVYFSTFNIFVLEYIAFHVTKFHLQWIFLHVMEFVYPKICIIAIFLLCAAYKSFDKSPIFLRSKDILNSFHLYIIPMYFWILILINRLLHIVRKWIWSKIYFQNYTKFHSFYSTKRYNSYLLINHIVLHNV